MHKYRCGHCRKVFAEPKKYNSNPTTRKCILCLKGKGNIAYLGSGRYAAGIITDSIETLSPADGKMYTSKAKYYQALKDNGNHVVEPGEQGKGRSLQGDYNLRPELTRAIQQHL